MHNRISSKIIVTVKRIRTTPGNSRESANLSFTREWKSYGWPSYLKGYLNHPRHNPNFDYFTTSPAQTAYLNRTFMNLFLAIGKSHSLPAQFEVILRSERLEDAAFKFPPRVDALIYPVLANLKTLFLDLKCNNYDPVFLNDGSASRAFRFQNFISKFTRLEHMRVNFDSRGSVHNLDLPEEVLSWLSEPIGKNSQYFYLFVLRNFEWK